jgi:transcriptional regulator with XRE-family HTH domain
MNGKQFTAALAKLGISSHRKAARVLGLGRSTIIRYVHGRTPVPEPIIRLIDMLSRYGIPREYTL